MTVRASLSGFVATVALAALIYAPATANAQNCAGAPGASAVVQYCEAIPRADGAIEVPSDKPGAASGTGSQPLSSTTNKALTRAGEDGAAVKRLSAAEGSAGKSAARDQTENVKETTNSERQGGVAPPTEPSGNPLVATTKAVSSGPTAGAALVSSLVGLTVLGAGAAVFTRRRQSMESPASHDESSL